MAGGKPHFTAPRSRRLRENGEAVMRRDAKRRHPKVDPWTAVDVNIMLVDLLELGWRVDIRTHQYADSVGIGFVATATSYGPKRDRLRPEDRRRSTLRTVCATPELSLRSVMVELAAIDADVDAMD